MKIYKICLVCAINNAAIATNIVVIYLRKSVITINFSINVFLFFVLAL
jgi:hypothetical protein